MNIFFATISLIVFFILSPFASAAETTEWYKNYNENRFVVEIPITEENMGVLNQRLSRLQYSVIYLNDSTGTVSFRIGFFKSVQQATEQVLGTKGFFKNARVLPISVDEHQIIYQYLASVDHKLLNAHYFIFDQGKENESLRQDNSKKTLEYARQLFSEKKYQQAAESYLALSVIADSQSAVWALELSGLCYEKLHQFDQAINTYANLLSLYPESSGRVRVEQRLRALITAPKENKEALKKASKRKSNFSTRGVFGQHYRTLDRKINNEPSEQAMSLLTTDLDFRTSASYNGHGFSTRISGYRYDDRLENGTSETQIKRAYLEYHHEKSGTLVSVGRQRDFDSGIYSSYDGISAKYPIWKNLTVGASLGTPIFNSDIFDSLNYKFQSLYMDWDYDDNWGFGTYLISQTVNGVTDREGLGGKVTYNDTTWSASFAFDFNTAFSELNNLLLSTTYNISSESNVSFLYGKQRSPFLTASNILIGQPQLDLDLYLAIKENRDTLLDDAFARTSLSTYYYLSYNAKLAANFRIIVDYYDSELTEVPTSDFLLGLISEPSTTLSFSQNSIGMQMILENAFVKNDSTSIGVRRSGGETSTSSQVYLNERIRFGGVFTLMPKISYTTTDNKVSNDTRENFRFSLDAIYRIFRSSEIDVEIGKETISSDLGNIDFTNTYFFAGYRLAF